MKIVYILLSGLFLIYLALPTPDFPLQIPESIQSTEPADKETPFRRSYFSDYTREKIITHYLGELKTGVFGLPFLTIKLNYPPEESQTLVRDQTRSTFLEEIVHPFRESIFVNGYEPKKNQDIIYVNDKNWKHKITVKQNISTSWVRLLTGIMVITFIPFLASNLKLSLQDLRRTFGNFRI